MNQLVFFLALIYKVFINLIATQTYSAPTLKIICVLLRYYAF
jgi:hypothetical protein